MKPRPALMFVIVCSLAYALALANYSHIRPVDGDEGYYTTAARLVWEGKTPYHDFFYQQAPLLPYLYSWVWGLNPHSLIAMRLLSVACGGLAVFLWGLFLLSSGQCVQISLATFAAILLNPYWVSWHVVVKTYAAANLLVSIAIICFYWALHRARPRWYFGAGLALGLCTSVRSLYGPIIPAVVIWVWYHERRQIGRPQFRQSQSITLLAGATVGLLPILISFVQDSRAFIFNNIQYHGLDAGYVWLDGRLLEGYRSVGHVVLLLVAHAAVGLFVFHPYFCLEVVVAIIGIVSWRRLSRSKDSAHVSHDNLFFQLVCLMLVVYTATALIPFPPYEQYFDSPLVPFLVVFVSEGLRVTFRPGRKLVFVLPALAIFLCWAEISRESAWNSNAPEWHISSYRRVASEIEANTLPGEVVLSFWPGYVFESGRRYWPGLDDNFIFRVTTKISPDQRSRYHIASIEEIIRAVALRTVNVIVIAPRNVQREFYQDLSEPQLKTLQAMLATNYSLIRKINDVEVYRRRSANAQAGRD